MHRLALALTLCALGCLFIVPAAAQDGLDPTLGSFSIFPNTDITTKFDLTSIDFTKAIPADYVIGAGDVLVVDLGNIAGDQQQLSVSPQGSLFVPVVGKVDVGGMTVPEVTVLLTEKMTPWFRNFNLSITVGRVRKIEVQLSGMVNTPGTYIAFGGTTLSHFMQIVSQRFTEEPLNTAVPMPEFVSRTNTRFRALLPEGTYRRIKVYRQGQLFRTVDLATLMIFGDSTLDVQLEAGDRIHVPSMDKYVVFDDSVPFSGKVELLPGDSIENLIKMVGGPENFAVSEIVEVQAGREGESRFFNVRVKDGEIVDNVRAEVPMTGAKPSAVGQAEIAAFNAAYTERIAALPAAYQPGQKVQLVGGELIRIPRANDVVYLAGAWLRPGVYGYRAEWTLFDYIGQSGGFFPGAQEGEARWIRRNGPNQPFEVQYISLKDAMLGKVPLPQVQPGDMLYVPLKNNQWPGPTLLTTLLNFGTQARIFQK